MYNWTVDLTKFKFCKEYPGYFHEEINAQNTQKFEDKFRDAVIAGFPSNQYLVCGEVYYWKNNRSLSNTAKTKETIDYLATPARQKLFIESLKELAKNPIHNNFKGFRKSCYMPNGFATPITYLSFYNPDQYPMIDKIIAEWWRNNMDRFGFDGAPLFRQRNDGWIQSITEPDSMTNWNAYLAWTEFCRHYSAMLSKITGASWRARDVEMAVWESQKRCYPLDPAP
ncbi:MAG: hypothetical protein ABFC78_05955 [Methanoregula sp.]